jgi:predicted component of type VI protein secretion system
MKNPKARTPKKSAQASRTMTRQSAMKDINRGPDSLNLTTSELGAHEIADLKRKFSDGEVFELPDSDIPSPAAMPEAEEIAFEVKQATSNKIAVDQVTATATNQSVSEKDSQDSKEDGKQQSTKDKPQTRFPLPPKPFTIISGFRK